jgi:hypothetical protein
MTKGIQRQIVITASQHAWILKQATKFGITEAEVIRRAIDEVRSK